MRSPHLARKEGSIKPLSLHGWTIVLDARSKVGCQRGSRWAGSVAAAAPASPASVDSPDAAKAAAPAAAATPILCLWRPLRRLVPAARIAQLEASVGGE
eukprot:COSAG02_NODE_3074_length_7423_cov_1.966548_4_plen_99_part_00